MGPRGCPETSVRKYYYSLRNSPEERSVQPPLRILPCNLQTETEAASKTPHGCCKKCACNSRDKFWESATIDKSCYFYFLYWLCLYADSSDLNLASSVGGAPPNDLYIINLLEALNSKLHNTNKYTNLKKKTSNLIPYSSKIYKANSTEISRSSRIRTYINVVHQMGKFCTSRRHYVLTPFALDKSHFKTANYLTNIFNNILRIISSGRKLQSAVSAACNISATLCQIMPQFTCLAQTFQRLQIPINSAQALD